MNGVAIVQYIMSTSLHQEIHRITDTARRNTRGNSCSRGYSQSNHVLSWLLLSYDPGSLLFLEVLVPPYLNIWRCPPCKRFKNIRSDSVLSGQKLSSSLFLLLVFYLSIKSLPSVAISQLIGVSGTPSTTGRPFSTLESPITLSLTPLLLVVPA
jgi:hypothetical protein